MNEFRDLDESTTGDGTAAVRAASPETPDEFQKLHSILVKVAIFFVVYMLVEGVIFLPVLLLRYGWQV